MIHIISTLILKI